MKTLPSNDTEDAHRRIHSTLYPIRATMTIDIPYELAVYSCLLSCAVQVMKIYHHHHPVTSNLRALICTQGRRLPHPSLGVVVSNALTEGSGSLPGLSLLIRETNSSLHDALEKWGKNVKGILPVFDRSIPPLGVGLGPAGAGWPVLWQSWAAFGRQKQAKDATTMQPDS